MRENATPAVAQSKNGRGLHRPLTVGVLSPCARGERESAVKVNRTESEQSDGAVACSAAHETGLGNLELFLYKRKQQPCTATAS